jgi:hypothetical protein
MGMASDLDADFDDQDQSEVFDEDNNELEEQRYSGRENEQTLEDLPDVLDVTQAVGDDDDEEAGIGEEMDDDEIVARARDNDEDDDDLEDDDLARRDEEAFEPEGDLTSLADADAADLDDVDRVDALEPDEVPLEYVGDLNDLEGAASAAQGLEAERLSDADLRELDYKDEFTVDEDGPPAR